MLRYPRYFSIASLVCVCIAALALSAYYRNMAINTIERLAEGYSAALSRTALHSVQESLIAFLLSAENAKEIPVSGLAAVRRMTDEMFQDADVARVKLFTKNGRVAYSTNIKQIGLDQSANPAVAAALRGEVSSQLLYRGRFNFFDAVTESANLIHTYLPVRSGNGDIVGVMEIYRDGSASVREIESVELAVLIGAIVILGLLYAALQVIVGRVERLMEAQQRELADRADTLVRMSAQMLNREEAERREIAQGLHEGVAQTLSAVRLSVATVASDGRGTASGNEASTAEKLLPFIEQAIDEVVETAIKLHPPSLHELGLIATVNWLCREFGSKHPNIRLTSALSGTESQIIPRLKPIVYRVLEQALRKLAKSEDVRQIKVELKATRRTVELCVTDEPTVIPMRAGATASRAGLDFEPIRDYVVVSGGEFESTAVPQGRSIVKVRWRQAA